MVNNTQQLTDNRKEAKGNGTDLYDIRVLILYWRVRRDEAERMLQSLMREERVIQQRRQPSIMHESINKYI